MSDIEVEEKFAQVDEVGMLSENERIKVFEEMEEIFLKTNDSKKKLDFSTISAPKGIKLPLIFNVVLIGFVIVAILTTTVLLDLRQSKNLSKTDEVSSRKNAFTKRIIEKNKAQLNNKTDELDSLRAELDALLSGKQTLDSLYTRRISDYSDALTEEIRQKLLLLRKQLEARNLPNAEIEKRLRIRKAQLEREYIALLKAYKKTQAAEKKVKEKELNVKINALESEYDVRTDEIKALQNEIKQRELELEREERAVGNQLAHSQSILFSLRQEKEEKDKDLRRFNLQYRRIIRLVKGRHFSQAKRSISESRVDVLASKFIESPEVSIFIETYDVYEVMITTALIAENIIENAANERAKLLQERLEHLIKIAELEQRVRHLISQISSQKAALSNAETSLDVLNNDYDDLRKTFLRLDQDYTKVVEGVNVLIDEAVANVKAAQLNSVLENIKYISNYLALKSQGINDIETSEIVKTLIIKNKIYASILDILTIAIEGVKEEISNTQILDKVDGN